MPGFSILVGPLVLLNVVRKGCFTGKFGHKLMFWILLNMSEMLISSPGDQNNFQGVLKVFCDSQCMLYTFDNALHCGSNKLILPN